MEPESQEESSIFDFLYHDARRIASFMAQLDSSGHLQQIKETSSIKKTSNDKTSLQAAGGLPALLKGSATVDLAVAEEGARGVERVYDPLWANARSFLDSVHSLDILNDNISSAHIGDFVIVSGALSVLDCSMFKGLWADQYVKKLILSSMDQEQLGGLETNPGQNRHAKRASNSSGSKTVESNFSAMMNIFSMFPHVIQANIVTDNYTMAWSTLRDDGMVVSSSDIVLKHGTSISGRWNMVGVLDAKPDNQENSDPVISALQDLGISSTPIGQVISNLTPLIKSQLGRPQDSFGVTPLLIFRTVSPSR